MSNFLLPTSEVFKIQSITLRKINTFFFTVIHNYNLILIMYYDSTVRCENRVLKN